MNTGPALVCFENGCPSSGPSSASPRRTIGVGRLGDAVRDVLVCVRKMRHESTRGGHGGAETPVTLDMRHIRYRGFMGAAG